MSVYSAIPVCSTNPSGLILKTLMEEKHDLKFVFMQITVLKEILEEHGSKSFER